MISTSLLTYRGLREPPKLPLLEVVAVAFVHVIVEWGRERRTR